MNKRIVSLLLSVVMMLSVLVSAVPVYAVDDNGLSAPLTGVSAGDVFTVTLKIPAVADVAEFFEMKVTFDKAAFEAVSNPTSTGLTYDKTQDAAGISTMEDMNKNGFYSFNLNNVTIGEDATITADFKVKEGAVIGSHAFELTVADVGAIDAIGLPVYVLTVADFTHKEVGVAVVIPVTGVTIQPELTLKVGETKTPEYKVIPENATIQDVKFTSSNTTVATVNETTGAVTGLIRGTATITITTVDGNFSATCNVTVECNHTYTVETKSAETLKTAGNCRDAAVYYYSCSLCGDVEKNDEHTFNGDKVADSHVGGTELVGNKAANHKTQENGYTGDTKCLGCGETLEVGQVIPAGEHTPGNWVTDGTNHWKVCEAAGCGVIIDGTKAAHVSDKAENKATCKAKAVCDICGISYGDILTHSFTVETKSAETLKTAGNCRDAAVYYYSCSLCGDVEKNDEHTFNGDKVADSHVGGTELVGNKAANHKTQENGYTGDTKCLGCGGIVEEGQVIPAGEHTPGGDWLTNGTEHWKVCTAVDCGVVVESSKGNHASTGDNVATCQKNAVCDACGVSYGDVADHNWQNATCTEPKHCLWCPLTEGESLGHSISDWKSDKDGHWKTCTRTGCVVILEAKAAHVDADDNGVCDTCTYVIAVYRTFTFDANGGEGEMAAVRVVEGEEYELPKNEFTAPNGMKFAGWKVYGETLPEGATITVSGDATIEATWQKTSTIFDKIYAQLVALHNKKYDVVAKAGVGGTISPAGVSKVKFQKTITYTITPDEGYAIKSVIVDGKDIGAVSEFTFKKVRGNHTIRVEFEKNSLYSDVAVTDWFYDDVVFVTVNNLMNGTGNGKFSPATTTDRAMIVTILWRLEGCPVVDGDMQFNDVEAGQWYTEAIKWAAANKIVNGFGNGKFGPTNKITREQVMAILNRYADYKGIKSTLTASASAYTYSDWAAENVEWAVSNGITNGIKVDIRDMTAEADRAEIAAYLTRFCKMIID